MNNKNLKKIMAIIILTTIFLTIFKSIIFAVSINQRIKIENFGKCDYTLQYKRTDGTWSYVSCTFVGYRGNGKIYPAYCLNRELPGVGEIETYDVDLTKLMDDYRLWRVVINGYPYKTPEEMGVYNKYDAFVATKQAIYSILYNNDVDTYYRGGNERGERVFNAVRYMVNEGRYGTYTPKDYKISINKVGELKEENNYYSQEYSVSSRASIASYTITNITNMPSGAYTSKLDGTRTRTLNGGENFKVMIPKESMNKDYNIHFNIVFKSKLYPIFYGKTTIPNTQNYLITADPYGDLTGAINLYIKGNTADLKIKKIDKETGETLSGVTYEIKLQDGSILGNYITNNSGEIKIKNLYPQTITITEKQSKDEYILNSKPQQVRLEWNKTASITFENMHKKGNLKIVKVDKDDNDITLGAVEFDLIDSNGNIVKHLITNVNGVAETKNINTGNYTLRETLTKKEYNLAVDQNVVVNWNKTMEYKVENEKRKGQIKIIKVDLEHNETKLSGVEFQIIDKDNHIIETIKTDSNGEAITSRIPIGEYKLKEIKTDNMHILNDEVFKVNVKTDIVSRLNITNERIKGQIKVIKTSEDDNFINGLKAGSPIPNVRFEIYDLNNNKVDELTTLEDGTAISKLLDKGTYIIQEVESGKWYLLNENIFTAEIKEHKEIVNVKITDESEKPNVDIKKTGIIQTTSNQEIRYDFQIKNTGNVKLNRFTWYDYIPTDYVRITKLITGTYNQDLNYSIYYKTNKNDYKLLEGGLNTQVNNYIDFSNLELEKDEYVTEFKADFGTVDIGFESVISPYIFVKVKNDVKDNDTFINKTRIEGYNDTYLVWDEDSHATKVYEKKIEVKKLPRTGL